jgi:hypothetical protein
MSDSSGVNKDNVPPQAAWYIDFSVDGAPVLEYHFPVTLWSRAQRSRCSRLRTSVPERTSAETERDEARAVLEAQRAEHAKKLQLMRNIRFRETERLIEETKRTCTNCRDRSLEVTYLREELRVAKEEAEVLKLQLARAEETIAENLASSIMSLCTWCHCAPAHVAVVPCGHRCFCTHAECSARVSALRTCPLCRMPIAGTLRIF